MEHFKGIVGVIVLTVGCVAGFLFLVAGAGLYEHGQNLVELQSKSRATSGDVTVAEVYYNEIGYCNKGYGLAAIATGVAVAGLSLGVGVSLWQRETPVSRIPSK